MSKNVVWENPQDELLDTPQNFKPFKSKIEEITEIETQMDKKDFIIRNGKKYYKTETNYVYKCENGYYAYRIVHKPSKTNSFVNRHINTKERFNTEYKANKARLEHIIELEKDKTFLSIPFHSFSCFN